MDQGVMDMSSYGKESHQSGSPQSSKSKPFVMPKIKEEPIDPSYPGMQPAGCPGNFHQPYIKQEPTDPGYGANYSQMSPCIGQSNYDHMNSMPQHGMVNSMPPAMGGGMGPDGMQQVPNMNHVALPNGNMQQSPNIAARSSGGKSNKEDTQKKKKTTKKTKVKTEIKQEIKQEPITDHMPQRKKRDRFNGMTEEEVLKRLLPDHLKENLDIVIIGINPGLTAAYVGHHYAGPGNHFWKCLYLSGLIPEPMNAFDDHKLLQYGIGFTNIVARTTRGSADLTRKEIKEGAEILTDKIQKYKPKIAVFNGKGIYEVFVGKKDFYIGKQPEPFPGCPDTAIFVMPSSSARFTQLPRAVDKVPFYEALKKLRDHLRGELATLNEEEICFPNLDLKVKPKQEPTEQQEGIQEKSQEQGQEKSQEEKSPAKPKRVRKRRSKGKAENETEAKAAMEKMSQSMPAMGGGWDWGQPSLPPGGVKQEPGTESAGYPGQGLSLSFQEPCTTSRHPYWNNSMQYSSAGGQQFPVKQENMGGYAGYGGIPQQSCHSSQSAPMAHSWPGQGMFPHPNLSYPSITVSQNFWDQSNSSMSQSNNHLQHVSQSSNVTQGFSPSASFASSHLRSPSVSGDTALNLSNSQNFSPALHSSPVQSQGQGYSSFSGHQERSPASQSFPSYPQQSPGGPNESALNLTAGQSFSPNHHSSPIVSRASPLQPYSSGAMTPTHNSPMPAMSPPQHPSPISASYPTPNIKQEGGDQGYPSSNGGVPPEVTGIPRGSHLEKIQDTINQSFQY